MVVLGCNHDGDLWYSQCGEDTPTPGGFESLGGTEGTGSTPVPLFLAGNGGVPVCVPVTAEDDRITERQFDERCSS